MQINIQPFDTLFVRDGKPFSMGEDVWANGIFPPPPSVVYGALRTAHFSKQLKDLQEAGGANDVSSSLRINQLLLTKKEKVFFPCPYDVVSSKTDQKNDKKEILKLREAGFPNSSPASFIQVSTKIEQPIESLGGKHFLGLADLNDYLKGSEDISTCNQDDFFEREPKIGIQKDRNTGAAAEGRLYRVEMFRPKFGTGLFVDWSTDQALNISPSGFLKIGGEGKAVSYTAHHLNIQVRMPEIDGQRFKLVFATPAVFANGWLPSGIDPRSLEGEWQGCQVKILGAAFDRPIYLGGFRMRTKHQKGGPKPMRKAVPAGAVYHLELLSGNVEEVAKVFHGKCISDFGLDREGFGLAYVGKV
jgi:CRISPR-associated protein Cmr3